LFKIILNMSDSPTKSLIIRQNPLVRPSAGICEVRTGQLLQLLFFECYDIRNTESTVLSLKMEKRWVWFNGLIYASSNTNTLTGYSLEWMVV
jgi:hypothetical protein